MLSEILENISDNVVNIKMFPIFDTASYLLVAMEINSYVKIRENSLVSLFLTIFLAFSGSIFAGVLLGEPPLTSLDNSHLFLCILIWAIVFYLPINFEDFPVKLIAGILNEIYRANKLKSGLLQAEQIYPNSCILMAIIGTVRSNGTGVCKYFFHFIQNSWISKSVEPEQPSFLTKAALLISFALQFNKSSIAHLGAAVFFVFLKMFPILHNKTNVLRIFLPANKIQTQSKDKSKDLVKESKKD